jgi:hypothetical protein
VLLLQCRTSRDKGKLPSMSGNGDVDRCWRGTGDSKLLSLSCSPSQSVAGHDNHLFSSNRSQNVHSKHRTRILHLITTKSSFQQADDHFILQHNHTLSSKKNAKMALATTSEQGRHLILPMPNTAFRFNDITAQLFARSTPYKASLTGKDMPSLEWPDTLGGPWSGASKPVRLLDERRRSAIARWLQEESEDDEAQHEASSHLSSLPPRHPMIAKVVMDRKRKEMLLFSALSTPSLTNSSGTTSSSLSSSSRKMKSSRGRHRRRRLADDIEDGAESVIDSPSARKHKIRKIGHHTDQDASSTNSRLPVTPLPSGKAAAKVRRRRGKKDASGLASSSVSGEAVAHIGCQCGVAAEDKSTPMIQCNGCTSWYHLPCVGLGSVEEAPTEEENWFCMMCCEMASSMLTPGSLSSGLSVTPIFPRSAVLAGQQVRLSQGQLPVFAQPIETPSHYHRDEGHAHAFSSALALAPSPIVHSGSSLHSLHRPTPSSLAAGRARASRVGWHMTEPGSPLQHKGSSLATGVPASGVGPNASTVPLSSPSGRQWRSTFAGDQQQLLADGASIDSFGGLGAHSNDSNVVRAAAEAYLRTPSPRLSSAATFTPSTARRTRQSSNTVGGPLRSSFQQHHRRESSNAAARDFDDIFSTPSRILNGSASWGQANTSTGGMRHSRQPSFASMATTQNVAWGLSTPTRHLMDAGFQSDYSAGALPSLVHSSGGLDMGEFSGWHHLQMSPSSTTRAASRARQQSISNGRRTSSVRHPLTPERGSSSTFDASSSSPFPKTPTFDMYHQRHRFGGEAHGDDEDDENDHHLDLLGEHFDDHADDHHLSPYDMLALRNANGGVKASRNASISANRRMSSLSHAASRSPSFLSPSTSHTRTFSSNTAKRANHESASMALQGALDLKAGRTGATMTNKVVKSRTPTASNDAMTGLGIGFELNDVLEWTA